MTAEQKVSAAPDPATALENIAAEPFEVLTQNEEVEVSVVDDTPTEDRNRPPKAETEEEEEFDDTQFGDRIRKRIDKLRYEWNEERRAKESAVRENQEAVKYAQSIQGENVSLKKQLNDQSHLLYDQVSAKTDAEIDGAKRRYREAYEAGDAEAITEAQNELSKLHAEKSQFAYVAPAAPPVPAANPVAAPAPQQHIPPPDPLAVDWLKRNTWFQQPGYEEMTGFAIGLHEKLVKQGIDPRGNPQYYERIDKILQEKFANPGKDGAAGQAPTSRKTPVVAPARRGGGNPRKVELTSTQVALARKLGITPEQYASQLIKEQRDG